MCPFLQLLILNYHTIIIIDEFSFKSVVITPLSTRRQEKRLSAIFKLFGRPIISWTNHKTPFLGKSDVIMRWQARYVAISIKHLPVPTKGSSTKELDLTLAILAISNDNVGSILVLPDKYTMEINTIWW